MSQSLILVGALSSTWWEKKKEKKKKKEKQLGARGQTHLDGCTGEDFCGC
jgi:hypothetical protein